MVTSLLLALVGAVHSAPLGLVSGNEEWEETAVVQKTSGYHPMLQFGPTSTFMFVTPFLTAEGHYQVQAGHYTFHPELAIQLGNAEVNHLVDDLDPKTKAALHHAYAESLQNFVADYSKSSGVLDLTYTSEGRTKSFALHQYTEGDDQLASSISGDERGLPGVWNEPEPFPDELDARTRYKIGGLEGLQQFSKEATASDGAHFNLLDLRVDKSFRLHSTIGTWRRVGSQLKLMVEGKEKTLTISEDGRKFLAGGRPVYTRG